MGTKSKRPYSISAHVKLFNFGSTATTILNRQILSLRSSFSFLPSSPNLKPFQSESRGKVMVRYLREPFSDLMLLLHAVKAMCNTSCVCCRSSIHCQSENMSAYMSPGGGPRVRCVHFCMRVHNTLTFTWVKGCWCTLGFLDRLRDDYDF